MKTIGRATLATLIGITVLTARHAHAQFTNVESEQGSESSKDNKATKEKPTHVGSRSVASISFFPVAAFATAGGFATGVQGTLTNNGLLVDGEIEVGWKRETGKDAKGNEWTTGQGNNAINRVGLGGFYWTKESGDLYQIHARTFFSEQFGLQAAYLSSTSHVAPGPSYSFFFVYDLNSRALFGRREAKRGEAAIRKPRAFNIELGLGTYIDPSGVARPDGSPGKHITTLGFSTYINANLDLGHKVSLIASQWYVRDRTADLTRFALGVGYRF